MKQTEANIAPQPYPRFLDMLSTDDREFIFARSVEKLLAKGQMLYHQGDDSDNVFVLRSGVVKVHYIHDSGNSITASYYREGMLFGAHGCTPWAGGHVWSAQALVDCSAVWMRRADFHALVNRSVGAMRCALAVMEFKANQLRKVIRILATPTLEGRVVMALNHLGSLYGVSRGSTIEIDARFTHQELAEMVGASRQSVTTVLLALERSGFIRRAKHRISIHHRAENLHPELAMAH